jgi:hypothetical protein
MSDTKRTLFTVWHPASLNNYWTRPATKQDEKGGIVQSHPSCEPGQTRTVIMSACGSDYSYDRVYIQGGQVYALTLAYAAQFDEGKV